MVGNTTSAVVADNERAKLKELRAVSGKSYPAAANRDSGRICVSRPKWKLRALGTVEPVEAVDSSAKTCLIASDNMFDETDDGSSTVATVAEDQQLQPGPVSG